MSVFDPIQIFDDELGGGRFQDIPGLSGRIDPEAKPGQRRNQHGIVWQYQSGVGGLALPRDGRWRQSHDAR